MANIIKVYEVQRYDGLQIRLNWCGVNVEVEFKGGDTRHRAKFITPNLFIQDALEHDNRFGTLYFLTKSYKDTPKEKEKEASKPRKRVTKVKTVNDAMRWLTEAGYAPTPDDKLQDLMDKANVDFPNLSL